MSVTNSVGDYVAQVRKGGVDILEDCRHALESARRINTRHHFLNTIADERFIAEARSVSDAAKKGRTGRLAGVALSVKDCLCVKDVETTAGSAILRGYHPLFDATAVERAVKEGAMVIGKTAQDEFGFGGFSVNVGKGFERPTNPIDASRSCGGSSGGAAGLTRAATFPHLAIAESTGGSIVCPAAFCGVVGICPTYGRVSRYGLIDYANSLDKIGTMATTVQDAALLLEVISGHDKNDSTSSPRTMEPLDAAASIEGLRVGIIKEAFGQGVDAAVAHAVKEGASQLEASGATLTNVSLPNVAKYGVACYYIIAMCEASTNLAKYCGMRYGAHGALGPQFNDYFSQVRTQHFGDEAKRRLMLGTFARMAGWREAYYVRALKVRAALIEEYQRAFKNVDVLLSPTMPMVAPTFDEIAKLSPLQNYMADILTVGPNLAGLPHASVPVGNVKNLPVGLQLIANHFDEKTLIRAAGGLQ